MENKVYGAAVWTFEDYWRTDSFFREYYRVGNVSLLHRRIKNVRIALLNVHLT
jgi:hypothetical protein